jgi:YHS domain-containing protein
VQVVEPTFAWNYTTVLNLIFLVVFAGIFYLYKNRETLGGGQGYALDPVCGMQVETSHAPASARHEGHTSYFCSDRCRDRFLADPARFADEPGMHQGMEVVSDSVIDPVCGMTVEPATAPSHEHRGQTYYFCCEGCRSSFAADPDRYLEARVRAAAGQRE